MLGACTEKSEADAPAADPGPQAAEKDQAAAGASADPTAGAMLLLAQAQFDWEEVDGKRKPKPGAAKLVILTPDGEGMSETVLEDEDSRVFHKAMCIDEQGLTGIVTIGATDAKLKVWRHEGGKFVGETLWSDSFGGKFDRLRDIELGDVDGDGSNEMVIATHDMGVIVVLDKDGDTWKATRVFEKPGTFVHEIELGDVDGDGALEIFATPSDPNKANATQAGGILRVAYNKKTKSYDSSWVTELKDSHAKEIHVTDLDGDGTAELYAAIEAKIVPKGAELTVAHPVQVRRYSPPARGKARKKGKGRRKGKTGAWVESVVATFPDGLQARVILTADLTGSGTKELIVTTMKDGVWRVIPAAEGKFSTTPVDRDSGGFEHAAGIGDIDADGKPELYVTSDQHDEIRRYSWDGSTFAKTVLGTMEKSDLTWNIVACSL